MKKSIVAFLLLCWLSETLCAQQELSSTGFIIIKLTNTEKQLIYRSGNLLAELDKNRNAFVYKIPSDSVLMQWNSQEFSTNDPFREDFIEIVIETKDNPIDFDNFDGENLELDARIIFNGATFHEKAMFSGYYEESGKAMFTTFRITLELAKEDYLKGLYDKEFVGELEFIVNDALVYLENDIR